MPNILILSQRHDLHSDRLCEEITKVGARPFRIDSEDALNALIWFKDGKFYLNIGSEDLSAGDIESVFVRKKPTLQDFGGHDLSSNVDIDTYIAIQKENIFQEFFFSLQLTARFYNTFGIYVTNQGKLGQQAVARAAGFHTADCMAGGRAEDILSFVDRIKRKGSRVCTKPLSAKNLLLNGESYTRYTEMLDDNLSLADEDVLTCPLIWQEYIEKDYEIRVTVIDSSMIAIRIDSQRAPQGTKIDWRKYNYPQTPHSVYTLPLEIEYAIRKFHDATGLRYSAFDLVRSKDGRYFFLETNPGGQWLWLETLTGAPITAMIAQALIGSRSATR